MIHTFIWNTYKFSASFSAAMCLLIWSLFQYITIYFGDYRLNKRTFTPLIICIACTFLLCVETLCICISEKSDGQATVMSAAASVCEVAYGALSIALACELYFEMLMMFYFAWEQAKIPHERLAPER